MTRKSSLDISALLKRQDKKVRKWAQEWNAAPPDSEPQSIKRIHQYLSGADASTQLNLYLSWVAVEHKVALATHASVHGLMPWEDLAMCARYGLSSALVAATRVNANGHGAKGPTGSQLALLLGALLIADWRKPAIILMQAIREGLDSPFVNWSQLPYFYPHFKFLVLLVADGQGQPLDRTVYGFTARDMKDVPAAVTTYETVLANWRSTDLDQVRRLVGEMADFHVISSTKDMEAFSSQSEYLFPYEILAFLRMREWAGLENPKSFEHPLMNTPLAVLPPAPLPWPEDPLLDAAIAKFKTEYPAQNYFDRLAAQT